jgi:alkaline phosphatase D
VRRGKTAAVPRLAHTVHVEVNGLEPDRWYWYRFRSGDAESPIGRTRTMPAADAKPGELRFAFASCQNWESGWYTAYEHMAKEELDLVFHLGDYIYEHGVPGSPIRKHAGSQLQSLDDYRLRHTQYKTDPLLQAMHARCPWIVTWDDHELSNDYANDRSLRENELDTIKFLVRRANAYQAYYEMMPLRAGSLPKGPHMQLYRQQSFGRLADFLVLDGRQHRSPQPNGDQPRDLHGARSSPKCSMLGTQQCAWVEERLTHSPATWKVLAQQVLMALIDTKSGDGREYSMDHWGGYVCERDRLMKLLHDRQIANTIVLTGDNHTNWVNDLRVDDLRLDTPVVATEFVGTSITSSGNGGEHRERGARLMAENPNVRYFNAERGYVRCTVTPREWRSDFRTVPYIDKPGAPVRTRASIIVESGKAGAKMA